MSDAVHSLGFGQNISIYHENSIGFRHYSDKMMAYIFSSSFIKWIEKYNYSEDIIWKFLKSIKLYDAKFINKSFQNEELLYSLFLSKERFPFIKRSNPFHIKDYYLNKFRKECSYIYFSNFLTNLSHKNIYSIYMHLYENFHWQGGTVMSIDEAARFNGYQVSYPFHDRDFINFMATIPEKYGRGLELLPAKYLWKNFLDRKLNYPVEYQSGPHSYQYDTNPSADLHAQIYDTKFGEALRNRAGLNLVYLKENFFNIFLNKDVKFYLNISEIM
jgi:hypothetical protein